MTHRDSLTRLAVESFLYCFALALLAYHAPAQGGGGRGALSDDVRLTFVCLQSDICLSVAYIGPKSRAERPRKTKIGREVAHGTRDSESDTTFKVKKSKVNCRLGRGHIEVAFRTAC